VVEVVLDVLEGVVEVVDEDDEVVVVPPG